MKQPHVGERDIRLPHGTGRAASMLTMVALLSACRTSLIGPELSPTYRIVAGACGDVVFAESVGVDSASAVTAIELRKAEKHGAGKVMVELHPLQVVDQNGNPPHPNFYALYIVDAESGMLAHSVYEAITNAGDLFHLRWCPD